MTSPWTAPSLEFVRHLAVSRVVNEGDPPNDVAQSLGVSERSVWRWLASWRREGAVGLTAKPGRGRPAKLTKQQAQRVLSWIQESPGKFGFVTDRWTAPRVATLIERFFDVRMNARYLNDWLRRRGITPQMPQRTPRERDQSLIDAWIRYQWPRVNKK